MNRESVTEAALGLLWSAWAELGVRGVERRHDRVAVDPEPLIVFTPALASDDPRLIEQVSAWCARHGEIVSKTRLWGLAGKAPREVSSAFTKFVGRLKGSAARWKQGTPVLADAGGIEISPPPLERPALARLRMRAVAGTGARADVLCELLGAAGQWLSGADLEFLGYTRRTLDRVFAELWTAGLVARKPGKAPASFRLRDANALATLVTGNDLLWPNWSAVLEAAWLLIELERSTTRSSAAVALLRAHEARERLVSLSLDAGLPEPPVAKGDASAAETLLRWGTNAVAEWPTTRASSHLRTT